MEQQSTVLTDDALLDVTLKKCGYVMLLFASALNPDMDEQSPGWGALYRLGEYLHSLTIWLTAAKINAIISRRC
jgi:hypothetical protein